MARNHFVGRLDPPLPPPGDPGRPLFAGCPIRAQDLTGGVLITGTPGAGKTELKNELIDAILLSIARGERRPWARALIFLAKPQQGLRHLEHIGIPASDLAILSPDRIDCRPHDVSHDYSGQDGIFDLSRLTIPANPKASEPFWTDSASTLLGGELGTYDRRASGNWYHEDVVIGPTDQVQFRGIIEGDPVHNRAIAQTFFAAKDNEKLRSSVLFTLETHMKTLRVSAAQLQAARRRGNPPFSFMRDWMHGDGPRIVVVCVAPTYAKSWDRTYVPLLLSTAIRAFMRFSRHSSLTPELTLWDLDEFAQLHMPADEATHFFSVCRELGGVPVVAVQSEPLLFSQLGEDVGRSVLANLSYVAHGASNDPKSAESASQQFGTHELDRVAGESPRILDEPRVRAADILRENDPESLRFYCRAPRLGKWRYDIQVADIVARSPQVTPELLAAEELMQAPPAILEPWDEADLARLGLTLPKPGDTSEWPKFIDPDKDWRTGE